MRPDLPPADALSVAERVRRIFATRNLTLAEVSRQSLRRFPGNPRYHIPHNLYYDLNTTALGPDIFQVLALSTISGYRLTDWLAVFGFDLEDVPRLQIAIPAPRTALLDAAMVDAQAWVPWFAETGHTVPPIAPASQMLRFTEFRRAHSLPGQDTEAFLYAKIGRQDAFAFPDLLPGSVVRVDARAPERFLPASPAQTSHHLFLVEHTHGVVCCRLQRTDKTRVTLRSSEAPYAEVTLDLSRQGRLLGVVDLEIRRLDREERPEVSRDLAGFWKPAALPSADRNLRLGELLRTCRFRSGLSFREASTRSRMIAKALGDSRFSIAASSLSDYETSDDPPRHIHKILSLCILYSIGFKTFLETVGLRFDEIGGDVIPEHLLPRGHGSDSQPRSEAHPELRHGGILEHAVTRLHEIPYFLRGSLVELTGLADLSLRDVFWIGGNRTSLHPYLRNALFVAVNRRFKRPRPTYLGPLWQQPLYALMKRDGSYILGRCTMEGDLLVVHPSSDGFLASERFRNRVDAEVVGRVVTILRRIIPDT